MKSTFEQMGDTYRPEGDYIIPNLELSHASDYQIGKYGHMRRSYLQENRPVLYSTLLTTGKLFEDLVETDKSCKERMETICTAMAKQEGVTEALETADQMEWARRMNSIHSRAEEIVLQELVYSL